MKEKDYTVKMSRKLTRFVSVRAKSKAEANAIINNYGMTETFNDFPVTISDQENISIDAIFLGKR